MKMIIPKQKSTFLKVGIEELHINTVNWISEIEFIKVEQDFLREMLSDHIIGLCEMENFKKAKLFLNGIEHEEKLGAKLILALQDHKMNLALLMENIYLKKEDDFRKNHEALNIEIINFIQNFKYIKEQVFKLVLQIMKKEKERKLLSKL
jgi:tRNA/tmRNA/rRNA uracil-C5-methylase (TrmA/RlmC/RlmD family)